MKLRCAKLSQLADIVKGNLIGNDIVIEGLGLCNRSTQYKSIISYMTDVNFADSALNNNSVKALIVTKGVYHSLNDKSCDFSYIIVENAEDAFYYLHDILCNKTEFYKDKIAKSTIGINSIIHSTASIEDYGVIIGDNVTIGANSVINSGTEIGSNTHIGCCSVIGSEGFQILRNAEGVPYNVKHIGGTVIGNNVWIGDNVTICKSLFEGAVTIGDYCQIDNHVQVAHNCIMGHGNVLTAGAIMLGSSELRNNCWLAPGALVMNRVVVEDGAFVGANSTANTRVKAGVKVIGTPAVPLEEFTRINYRIKKLIK